MRKLIVILMLVLFFKLPVSLWNSLTPEERTQGLKEVASLYASDEGCSKVRVSVGTANNDKEFIYIKLECLEKEM